jgi:kinetochore protein Fta7
MSRLTKRLPRMPFPPRTDERDFDYEGTLHRVRTLENQLTSNTHSVAILKAQINKEEEALRNEKEDLHAVEQSAKDARALRKEQSKKLHALARDQPVENAEDEVAGQAAQLELDLENDKDAKILVDQLRSHLESIRNNTAGTKEIVDVMEEVQAKLDVFSTIALTARQYETLHGVEVG